MQEEDYNYLLEDFPGDIIPNRYSTMIERVNVFITKYNLTNKVFLNYGVLDIVILDYFADIARLKEFEDISRVNKNKITAYMAYWWLKRKPLQIINHSKRNEDLIYINEKFITLFLIKDFMFDSEKDFSANDTCKKCRDLIYYHLRYRQFTAHTLELMLMAADAGKEIGKLLK